MKQLKTIASDKFILSGWLVLLFSSVMFCVPLLTRASSDQYMGYFALHFAIAVLYPFVSWINKDAKIDEHRIHYRAITLLLFLISAYALNREMDVFAASPVWFSVVLVLLSANYLSAPFFAKMPAALRHLSFALYGLGFVVFAYLALYLLPLYILSIPAMLALGISFHTFVPLLFCVFTVFLTKRLAQNRKRYWISFGSGIVGAVLFCFAFTVVWDARVQTINRNYTAAMAEGEGKLPLWVQVAQGTAGDGITAKILKTGLIYKTSRWSDNFFWSMPSRNFGNEQQLHDPLVTVASLFSGAVLLSQDDRIKILESQYNARHQALERLWSGEDLTTEGVATNVKVWPATHIAYTEKMLTVYNHQSGQGWNRQGEGIYTFHLPEGGVVTSLSLWVAGKEAKGILTSKEKAATAYRTVVGYERRDPSAVHWQEGATVSVRVFPVTAGESRTFKIGVTAPLRKEGAQLFYDNVWFDGPNAASAKETVRLNVEEDAESLVQQAALKPSNDKVFTRTGAYQPVWTVAFRDKGLTPHSFSFNGAQYCLQAYHPQRIPVVITDVYVDVNEAWSKEDIEGVWKLVQNKNVWVYNGAMKAVNGDNRKALFALQKQSFSLFPFHLVKDAAHSMVISKTGAYSPNLSDLEGSAFLEDLQARVNSANRVRLFQFGSEMSPYIRSLKERRCFDFESGEPALLEFLLRKNVFVRDTENENNVVVHSAGVTITKQPGEAASNAPDHLMRLFAYNSILQQTGKKDATASVDSTALIKTAQEAYVVSPVSSLVVLETQADYDRFGIKDSQNSLKNASLKGAGAVPEPAEWAIIILLTLVFVFFLHKGKIV